MYWQLVVLFVLLPVCLCSFERQYCDSTKNYFIRARSPGDTQSLLPTRLFISESVDGYASSTFVYPTSTSFVALVQFIKNVELNRGLVQLKNNYSSPSSNIFSAWANYSLLYDQSLLEADFVSQTASIVTGFTQVGANPIFSGIFENTALFQLPTFEKIEFTATNATGDSFVVNYNPNNFWALQIASADAVVASYIVSNNVNAIFVVGKYEGKCNVGSVAIDDCYDAVQCLFLMRIGLDGTVFYLRRLFIKPVLPEEFQSEILVSKSVNNVISTVDDHFIISGLLKFKDNEKIYPFLTKTNYTNGETIMIHLPFQLNTTKTFIDSDVLAMDDYLIYSVLYVDATGERKIDVFKLNSYDFSTLEQYSKTALFSTKLYTVYFAKDVYLVEEAVTLSTAEVFRLDWNSGNFSSVATISGEMISISSVATDKDENILISGNFASSIGFSDDIQRFSQQRRVGFVVSYRKNQSCDDKYSREPICFQRSRSDQFSCLRKGVCVAPNECKCSPRYKGEFCEIPSCGAYYADDHRVCNGRGKCTAQDNCECFGNRFSSNSFCSEPLCPNGCEGQCLAPNRCSCKTSLDTYYFGQQCKFNSSISTMKTKFDNQASFFKYVKYPPSKQEHSNVVLASNGILCANNSNPKILNYDDYIYVGCVSQNVLNTSSVDMLKISKADYTVVASFSSFETLQQPYFVSDFTVNSNNSLLIFVTGFTLATKDFFVLKLDSELKLMRSLFSTNLENIGDVQTFGLNTNKFVDYISVIGTYFGSFYFYGCTFPAVETKQTFFLLLDVNTDKCLWGEYVFSTSGVNTPISAKVMYDSNSLLVVGRFDGTVLVGKNDRLISATASSLYVLSLNIQSNPIVEWSAMLELDTNQQYKDSQTLAYDMDGNIFLGVEFVGKLKINDIELIAVHERDIVIIKFNGQGYPIWFIQLSANVKEVQDLVVDASGWVYFVGLFKDTLTIVNSTYSQNVHLSLHSKFENGYLLSIDPFGMVNSMTATNYPIHGIALIKNSSSWIERNLYTVSQFDNKLYIQQFAYSFLQINYLTISILVMGVVAICLAIVCAIIYFVCFTKTCIVCSVVAIKQKWEKEIAKHKNSSLADVKVTKVFFHDIYKLSKHKEVIGYLKFTSKEKLEILRKIKKKRFTNVIKILNILKTGESIGVLYVAGEVFKLDHKRNFLELLHCAIQMANGLEQLHSLQISHNDVKLNNYVMVQNSLKLIDLDDCSFFDHRIDLTAIGTADYKDPKLTTHSNLEKADVYSFGILLEKLFSNRPPQQIQKLIEKCTAEQYNSRPSMKSVVIELRSQYNAENATPTTSKQNANGSGEKTRLLSANIYNQYGENIQEMNSDCEHNI